ncbi:MAG TPA: hypothetical protein VGI33_02755 [Paenibacillus sp.]|jgi:hypothetical protein
MWMYFLVVIVALVGAFATFKVGFSPENQKRNPGYEQRTSKNITKLTMIYVVAIVGSIALLITFISYV